MRKIFWTALAIAPLAIASAQGLAPEATSSPPPAVSGATPAAAGDIEVLRQQVQSLTDMVKTLQQQVKDQRDTLEKGNLAGAPPLPQNPEPQPTTAAAKSPAR